MAFVIISRNYSAICMNDFRVAGSSKQGVADAHREISRVPSPFKHGGMPFACLQCEHLPFVAMRPVAHAVA
jgi:hypothetical protein